MLHGQTLLGERAMLGGFHIPGRVSAGGGCRLYDAAGDKVALNLSRPDDRDMLPALFETENLNPHDDAAVAAHIRRTDAPALVERGRLMGLAIARVLEADAGSPAACTLLTAERHVPPPHHRTPRVVDLSALWAGPLAGHLLGLTGAEVIKVESRTRPDGMRNGIPDFFALLNQGKASVVLDFRSTEDLKALKALLDSADIVIEAARPRALAQLGIDAEAFVRSKPGVVWITITAHGATGKPSGWVGFGDDCAVAGGLSAELHRTTGQNGFVGDAIADPLTGVFAATVAWENWCCGRGGRYGIAMAGVVAQAVRQTRTKAPEVWREDLLRWAHAQGQPFPQVTRRPIGAVAPFGADTQRFLSELAPC